MTRFEPESCAPRCAKGHVKDDAHVDRVRVNMPTLPGEGLERDRRFEFVLKIQTARARRRAA
jgi:hypothetical protein